MLFIVNSACGAVNKIKLCASVVKYFLAFDLPARIFKQDIFQQVYTRNHKANYTERRIENCVKNIRCKLLSVHYL
ncbi:MAG: hypothetical protein BMS9Abin19_0004 [Gammaproteobacteria bacterium]|nr:MAG: hypothetical protein BMS9Abin19_0004 [Gammaproteobacteria bacterium]